MYFKVFMGLLIPFLGTMLGSLCVFFMKKNMSVNLQKILSGFAAGVMVAASVWSLLIPSLEQASSSGMGKFSFIPAGTGFALGVLFLLFLDTVTPHIHIDNTVEGPKTKLKRTTMMVLAVTLHNIPEGMAVGVLYASYLNGSFSITEAASLALSVGIAIQNFPEGAIVSMPLCSDGISKKKAFLLGSLSGIVEPVFAFITLLLAGVIVPILPYLLSFAAGAMIYVVIEELVPEMTRESEKHSNWATIFFMLGFVLMMILDVALG